MQQALEDEDNEISGEMVHRWDLDIVRGVTESDVLEMLVRFYSLAGDRVHLYDWSGAPRTLANGT